MLCLDEVLIHSALASVVYLCIIGVSVDMYINIRLPVVISILFIASEIEDITVSESSSLSSFLSSTSLSPLSL